MDFVTGSVTMVCYSFPQRGGNYEYRRFKKTDCCLFMVSFTHNLKRPPIWIANRNLRVSTMLESEDFIIPGDLSAIEVLKQYLSMRREFLTSPAPICL
jgi:hypothetical protein